MHVKIVENDKERADAYYVRKTVFVEEQLVPLEEEIDQYEDVSTHFVLYDEHEPVGAGRFRLVDGKGKIERICIVPDYRGKGAGKLLMLEIEDFAKTQPVTTLKLNAQVHAIPFYERLGYRITSDEFLDAGIPHKSMEK
ncbi:GNAT family N-acetyltransferase [Heyndrickxia ginsengihumi]|uniref:Acetyltransferase n=1 Tax=Heyndrickxia ginsengihumi TaxID=363870 RepID=A0A0A6XYF9_9BACI|nr:GNAT family N-acetyltransferase [Heyndrickxia ginsengihumi]KHD85182.1 acetyltransferase [Heyndrickxia ginsengihumi]MBE6184062.1 GNAT family N-acetyltransferase [Bacillus sp. (in: firmicutes)]MCM3024583.1 GNAT family N-acetyltransferase [Heyndrickxia ginsengihumi]NEY18792.1 GNAT family N-acetyltransferase [Heyndrickxia ginsengihumi]